VIGSLVTVAASVRDDTKQQPGGASESQRI
jgi:hypothetical protein